MRNANIKLLLGITLLLVGGLGIPAGVLIPTFNVPNEEVVFESPGEARLTIEAPGRFYLWHNYRTVHEGRQVVRNRYLPDGMSFRVTRVDDGSTLPFQPRGSIQTEMGGSASQSVGYVDVERPGTLRVEVSDGDEQMRLMSFSRSRFKIFLRAIGFSVLSLVVLGSAGMVLLIMGITRRS